MGLAPDCCTRRSWHDPPHGGGRQDDRCWRECAPIPEARGGGPRRWGACASSERLPQGPLAVGGAETPRSAVDDRQVRRLVAAATRCWPGRWTCRPNQPGRHEDRRQGARPAPDPRHREPRGSPRRDQAPVHGRRPERRGPPAGDRHQGSPPARAEQHLETRHHTSRTQPHPAGEGPSARATNWQFVVLCASGRGEVTLRAPTASQDGTPGLTTGSSHREPASRGQP